MRGFVSHLRVDPSKASLFSARCLLEPNLGSSAGNYLYSHLGNLLVLLILAHLFSVCPGTVTFAIWLVL
jgi:hypothetical protein